MSHLAYLLSYAYDKKLAIYTPKETDFIPFVRDVLKDLFFC